jgi:hypothetical protein
MRTIRTGGVLTVLSLGTFVLLMVRRERRLRVVENPTPSPLYPGERAGVKGGDEG